MKRCSIQDDLASELAALRSKLNTLSPNWVRSEQAREEMQQRRKTLQAEIRQDPSEPKPLAEILVPYYKAVLEEIKLQSDGQSPI